MAIKMMVSEEHAGAPDVEEIPASVWQTSKPLYLRTSHTGLVLSLGERNGYDDSDFYALVWDPEKGQPERIEYGTTRSWTYPNGAAVDATPEVRAAYDAWMTRKQAEIRKAYAEQVAKTPGVGKTVKVVRGRKVPLGTVGEIFWMGADRFTPRWKRGPAFRVGIRTSEGETFWTAATNITVVLIENEVPVEVTA